MFKIYTKLINKLSGTKEVWECPIHVAFSCTVDVECDILKQAVYH